MRNSYWWGQVLLSRKRMRRVQRPHHGADAQQRQADPVGGWHGRVRCRRARFKAVCVVLSQDADFQGLCEFATRQRVEHKSLPRSARGGRLPESPLAAFAKSNRVTEDFSMCAWPCLPFGRTPALCSKHDSSGRSGHRNASRNTLSRNLLIERVVLRATLTKPRARGPGTPSSPRRLGG